MSASPTTASVKTQRAAPPALGKNLPSFRRALLRWYDANHRDLPWRRTRDPYRIWISEIMLQQTRVAAVLEHYRLFLERFPDIRALAAAPESAVLAAWSGLGYYRRARMMRQCAQKLVEENGGCFPATSLALQSLPGIGRYTAAAIASIAFGEPIAVVDGNVERVLERIAGRQRTKKEFWQQAQALLEESRPADFNQSMMELGALVCTSRQPKCNVCPIRKWCATRGEVPRTQLQSGQSKKEIWYTLEERGQRLRLIQRPANVSLMAGMWELPEALPTVASRSKSGAGTKVDATNGDALNSTTRSAKPAAKRRKPTAHGASRGSPAGHDKAPNGRKRLSAAPWRTFRHSITTTNYTVHVVRGRATHGKWVAIAKISDLPITGLTRKILKAAGII
ncbi:MAG: A/G-specific adenine glycosylase [Acidobacteria bacterium]|nr:A/G-specific adenine glycosylase [Acidobacteriota bacterium]